MIFFMSPIVTANPTGTMNATDKLSVGCWTFSSLVSTRSNERRLQRLSSSVRGAWTENPSRASLTELRYDASHYIRGNGKDRLAAFVPQISLARRCFPLHEIVERSSSFILNKFDDTCVIDEPKKRGLVRNQIEWIHQVIEGCDDPHKRLVRNVTVFAAMISAN